ncbi:MAG: hypothetical protein RIR26_13 [Pseudomonadota bacterium]
MYATGQIFRTLRWAMPLVLLPFSGCTKEAARVELPSGPVASPTSTEIPLVTDGSELPAPEVPSGPAIPFDGGRPEDLGSVPVVPAAGQQTAKPDGGIYFELTGARRLCAGEKP